MAKTKEAKKIDTSTEEKIKEAARVVFHKKGYAATRTRDIAEEADINLALLNYYFRSKEKLFDIIMVETLSGFLQHLTQERTRSLTIALFLLIAQKNMQHTHMSVLLNTDVLTLSAAREYTIPEALLR